MSNKNIIDQLDDLTELNEYEVSEIVKRVLNKSKIEVSYKVKRMLSFITLQQTLKARRDRGS